jgi:hypothetical protein
LARSNTRHGNVRAGKAIGVARRLLQTSSEEGRPMTRSAIVGLLLTLTATAARAQQDRPLSARERAWVAQLGERLGGTPSGGRFTLRVPAEIAAEEREPDGLRVTVGDLAIHRVRFECEALAHAVAARIELGHPMVGEVRGDQAVFITGAPLRDVTVARRALDAAWQGLPSVGPATSTFAYFDHDELAVTTSRQDDAIWGQVEHALRRAAQHPEVTTSSGPGEATVTLPSGRCVRARRDAQAAQVCLAREPARAAELVRYLATLTREAPARRGLREAIDATVDAARSGSSGE